MMYHIHDKVMHELSLNHIRTQVTVKLHDVKEDEQGERTAASDTRYDLRRYSVTAGLLIKVTLKLRNVGQLAVIAASLIKDLLENRQQCIHVASGGDPNRLSTEQLAYVFSVLRLAMNPASYEFQFRMIENALDRRSPDTTCCPLNNLIRQRYDSELKETATRPY